MPPLNSNRSLTEEYTKLLEEMNEKNKKIMMLNE